jgi:PhnB protein
MDLIPDFVPSGYKTVNVFLQVNDAEKALRFYNRVFSADILTELRNPEGRIVYAEFKVFDTIIMLTEDKNAHPDGVIIRLYAGDAEGVFDACVDQGCEVISPMQEQFNGDKAGRVKDPFGHQWIIARHLEDLSASELQKRFNQLYS